MIITGLHAAQQTAELRGVRWFCSGVQGPSAIPDVFRDRSWHGRYAALGLRIEGHDGADVRVGFKGYQPVPFDCSIMAVVLVADRAGSIVFDIYRSSTPVMPPRPTDTLISLAAYRPALATQQANCDDALFGWQTALTRNELLGFDVLDARGVNSVTLTLLVSPNHRI